MNDVEGLEHRPSESLPLALNKKEKYQVITSKSDKTLGQVLNKISHLTTISPLSRSCFSILGYRKWEACLES